MRAMHTSRTSISAAGRCRHRIVFGLAVAGHVTAAVVAKPVAAQSVGAPPQFPPAVTQHEGTFNGKRVTYTATVGETLVPNGAGKPAALIVSTAYTATGVDRATRPVIFVCNGGPISPSYPLHMLALGPKRLAIPPDLKADSSAFTVVDNIYTVLDVAD